MVTACRQVARAQPRAVIFSAANVRRRPFFARMVTGDPRPASVRGSLYSPAAVCRENLCDPVATPTAPGHANQQSARRLSTPHFFGLIMPTARDPSAQPQRKIIMSVTERVHRAHVLAAQRGYVLEPENREEPV